MDKRNGAAHRAAGRVSALLLEPVRGAVLVATMVLAFLWPGPAGAHAQLLASWPEHGSTVTAPAEIRLTFSEDVIAGLAGIVITREGGVGVKARATENGKELVFKLEAPLAPGSYLVEWRAVADDAHGSEGAFAFTVVP